MNEAEREAIVEVYTTLRAILDTYGQKHLDLGYMCAEGCSLLIEAFPWLAEVEQRMDSSVDS